MQVLIIVRWYYFHIGERTLGGYKHLVCTEHLLGPVTIQVINLLAAYIHTYFALAFKFY